MNAPTPPEGLRPFVVDPAVMARIRPMQHRDCLAVATLHREAMGDSLWARLGLRFLVELYRGLVESPRFLGFVYEEGEGEGQRIRGFIAGSTDGEQMMGEVRRSRGLVLAAAATPGVLASPRVLRPLWQTASYFRLSSGDDAVPGESMFCSFERDLRGKRVSGHINKVLFDELRARGHDRVKVTTEVDNVGANRQLLSWGFVATKQFEFYGKAMVRYELDLVASERVEPVSRHPAV